MSWDQYHDYAQVTQLGRDLVKAYPNLVKMESVGKSHEEEIFGFYPILIQIKLKINLVLYRWRNSRKCKVLRLPYGMVFSREFSNY
jgi:hypothetical protein